MNIGSLGTTLEHLSGKIAVARKIKINYHLADDPSWVCNNFKIYYKWGFWRTKRDQPLIPGRWYNSTTRQRLPLETVKALFKQYFSRIEVKVTITNNWDFWA